MCVMVVNWGSSVGDFVPFFFFVLTLCAPDCRKDLDVHETFIKDISVPTLLVVRSVEGGVRIQSQFLFKFCKLIEQFSSWCLVYRCVCKHKSHLVKGPLHKCGRIVFRDERCLMNLIHFLRFINEEYAGLLDPRDQYRLAATETEMWYVFTLRRYEERLLVERYWEMVDEGWFSD